MKGGFSFDGVDIAELGLEYVPELDDIYVYDPAEGEPQEQTFESHDGGYYYGVSLQPKDFTLRCYFEDSRVNRGVMAKIHHVFKKGRTGRLIFRRRPWCYYVATIVNVSHEFSNYENGLITIEARAYYPFARSDVFFAMPTHREYQEMKTNSAVVTSRTMIPSMEVDCSSELTQSTELLLLNPGTERAPVAIEIAGDAAAGVVIRNETTGEQCKYIGLTKAVTTSAGKYLCTDSLNGKTMLKSDTTGELCFLYHDSGFINLAPAFPAIRDLYVNYTGGTSVTVTNMLYDINEVSAEDINERYAGKHIFLDGEWREIAGVTDAHTLELTETIGDSGVESTMILKLNKITVAPVNTMALTRLRFQYKPTYA